MHVREICQYPTSPCASPCESCIESAIAAATRERDEMRELAEKYRRQAEGAIDFIRGQSVQGAKFVANEKPTIDCARGGRVTE